MFDRVESKEEIIVILTKKFYLFFFPMPHTSIMPISVTKFLAYSGIQIRWNTMDKLILEKCHKKIIEIVKINGLNKMRELANESSLNIYALLTPDISQYIKRII